MIISPPRRMLSNGDRLLKLSDFLHFLNSMIPAGVLNDPFKSKFISSCVLDRIA